VDDGETFVLEPHDPLYDGEIETGGADRITAPMPGKVVAVLATEGQAVRRGDALIVLEAMKMEHTMTAPRDGAIAFLGAAAGDQIAEGAVLVRFAGES
jgi:3-methylcrotonyl-CoA carboxylase alpha subunit